MKLHKSIRKYAKFNLIQFDGLIELNSFDLIEFYVHDTKSQTSELIDKAYVTLFGHKPTTLHITNEIYLYKHKTDELYLLSEKSPTSSTYFYLKSDLKTLHRNGKPASIVRRKDMIADIHHQYVLLTYYQDGKAINKCGPVYLCYKNYNSNEDILHLEKIEYNKRNGIIFYHVFTEDSKVVIEIIYRKKNRSYLLKYDYFKIMKVEAFFEKYDLIREYDYSNISTTSYIDNSSDYLHRINGPAKITTNQDHFSIKEWYINGNKLPNDIIHYEKGLEKNITKTDILKAMMFDREYGEFLNGLFCAQSS